MNQLVLNASVVEVLPLRYTPAGLPALNVRLEHESEATEAGTLRQVKASIKAVAIGSLAESLAKQPIGSHCRFMGFLASPRNSKGLVLHLQEFVPI